MVQEGGATGWGEPSKLFSSVLSPGDLMLTYGFNYHLDSDDSHIYGSSLDLSPELPIHIFGCSLDIFSGMSQRHLQLRVTPPPQPSPHPVPSYLVLPQDA